MNLFLPSHHTSTTQALRPGRSNWWGGQLDSLVPLIFSPTKVMRLEHLRLSLFQLSAFNASRRMIRRVLTRRLWMTTKVLQRRRVEKDITLSDRCLIPRADCEGCRVRVEAGGSWNDQDSASSFTLPLPILSSSNPRDSQPLYPPRREGSPRSMGAGFRVLWLGGMECRGS